MSSAQDLIVRNWKYTVPLAEITGEPIASDATCSFQRTAGFVVAANGLR
ncbi:MAG: hypothetical protein U0165_01350 [Polyangiaceae bacterium]